MFAAVTSTRLSSQCVQRAKTVALSAARVLRVLGWLGGRQEVRRHSNASAFLSYCADTGDRQTKLGRALMRRGAGPAAPTPLLRSPNMTRDAYQACRRRSCWVDLHVMIAGVFEQLPTRPTESDLQARLMPPA
jgi:hypothetical protein